LEVLPFFFDDGLEALGREGVIDDLEEGYFDDDPDEATSDLLPLDWGYRVEDLEAALSSDS
jgi:hypothetical protein